MVDALLLGEYIDIHGQCCSPFFSIVTELSFCLSGNELHYLGFKFFLFSNLEVGVQKLLQSLILRRTHMYWLVYNYYIFLVVNNYHVYHILLHVIIIICCIYFQFSTSNFSLMCSFFVEFHLQHHSVN